MRFDSIRLTNYRCHADLQVDFKPGFNVIVGVNGSGKTSLLNAVCDALAGLTVTTSLPNGNYSALSDPNVVRLKGEVFHGRYRFEPQYPVEVSATASTFESVSDCNWTIRKTSQVDQPQWTGLLPGTAWQRKQQAVAAQGEEVGAQLALSIVAFYRANRHWSQPQPHEMQAATARNARADGYVSWWDASLDAGALQSWVIGKCLERFQASSETGRSFDSIDSDELALANQALGAAVEGIKGLKYDLKQKSLLVEWSSSDEPTRQPTAFENLSDGQRAVIGLVADIARRMCVLNPQLGEEVTRKTPGVVLIDELDIHLHPRWQRILTSGLKRAFPKVQFIVASHSPQVLGELRPEEIIMLRSNGTDHPQVSYGLTSSQVLEEIMGADARAPEVRKMLSEIFEALERRELQAAQEQLVALEAEAPGIPELAGAWALLRRKEVLGR
ncbi:MAG TPA: AAA family ATPase [Rhodocyclaceae bacterium]|nr:AAA family ATPase [Rhodocyclaceae bacterium]